MQALLYGEWDRLDIVELPEPRLADPTDVLVRVTACGICGSELDAVRHRSPRRPPPLVMGHEFCGRIEQVGAAVRDWRVGDRVVAHALVHCGGCQMCEAGRTNLCEGRQVFGMHRPGAFAELVSAPARVLLPWPAGLSAVAACLAEPLANGINAITLDSAQPHDRMVVIGAGPIGLMCVHAARTAWQASILVTDLIAERRATAIRLGATRAIDPRDADLLSACRELWNNRRPTYVVDAVGSRATKREALSLVAPGGTVIWLGLVDDTTELDTFDLTLGERRVMGSYSGSFQHVQEAVDSLHAAPPPLDWIQTFPLGDGVTAFGRMLKAQGADIKAVLRMTEE